MATEAAQIAPSPILGIEAWDSGPSKPCILMDGLGPLSRRFWALDSGLSQRWILILSTSVAMLDREDS